MKKVMTILRAILFASVVLTSCGGGSIEQDAKKVAEPQEMDCDEMPDSLYSIFESAEVTKCYTKTTPETSKRMKFLKKGKAFYAIIENNGSSSALGTEETFVIGNNQNNKMVATVYSSTKYGCYKEVQEWSFGENYLIATLDTFILNDGACDEGAYVSFDEMSVVSFVETFYEALELTEEENQRQYEEGGVVFDSKPFLNMLTKDAVYSKDRLDNLTGELHGQVFIELQGVDLLESSAAEIYVTCTVVYAVSEVGMLYNIEKLTLIEEDGDFKVREWQDLGVANMEIADYEGLENFSENDFYELIGFPK